MTRLIWLASYPKSGMLPVWDLLFGTFHMPPGRLPEIFGADGVPESFFGQLIHPFAAAGRAP